MEQRREVEKEGDQHGQTTLFCRSPLMRQALEHSHSRFNSHASRLTLHDVNVSIALEGILRHCPVSWSMGLSPENVSNKNSPGTPRPTYRCNVYVPKPQVSVNLYIIV